MPVSSSSPIITLPPGALQFTTPTNALAAVYINMGGLANTQIMFAEKDGTGNWRGTYEVDLSSQDTDTALAQALRDVGNPAGANNTTALAWLASTSLTAAAAIIGPWFTAHVLPKIVDTINYYYPASAPNNGGAPAANSLALWNFLVGKTQISVGANGKAVAVLVL